MVSYSGTDLVGHAHGLEAPMMDAQLKSLDGQLGRLLDRLGKASGGGLALALSSDHGAIPAPEDASGKARGVVRHDWLGFAKSLEDALQAKWPAPGRRWILSAQTPHLDRALAAEKGCDWPDFKRRAAKVLAKVPGAHRALSAEDAAALPSSDPLSAVLRRSYEPARGGDLWVLMAENALLHDQAPGTSHGTHWDYDARVPLLFWGRGVKAGAYGGPAATVDLAPTLARLLGLEYAPGEGAAVRTEALTP
jgi:predicted AlkP superfamily pyrophosphatase or phosphodiesterase